MSAEHRPLGESGLTVTPVSLGCWPMAGVNTPGASHEGGVASVHAALDAGVTHFDTAYVYGPNGESDRILCEALSGRWSEVSVASKVGIHYEDGQMVQDARPETIHAECDTLLTRLGVERVDLLYLHSPDPETPVAETAGAISELIASGKARSAGASNCSLEQLQEFASACPLAAVQLPYNMLQRDIEQRTRPWCREHHIAMMVYWPLMKGLLSGAYPREYVFGEGDSRKNYPMFQGEEWQKNQDFLDELRAAAGLTGISVTQLVVNWTMNQSGITSVLCGAKRPEQILESAGAMDAKLTDEQLDKIELALQRRGKAAVKRLFE